MLRLPEHEEGGTACSGLTPKGRGCELQWEGFSLKGINSVLTEQLLDGKKILCLCVKSS